MLSLVVRLLVLLLLLLSDGRAEAAVPGRDLKTQVIRVTGDEPGCYSAKQEFSLDRIFDVTRLKLSRKLQSISPLRIVGVELVNVRGTQTCAVGGQVYTRWGCYNKQDPTESLLWENVTFVFPSGASRSHGKTVDVVPGLVSGVVRLTEYGVMYKAHKLQYNATSIFFQTPGALIVNGTRVQVSVLDGIPGVRNNAGFVCVHVDLHIAFLQPSRRLRITPPLVPQLDGQSSPVGSSDSMGGTASSSSSPTSCYSIHDAKPLQLIFNASEFVERGLFSNEFGPTQVLGVELVYQSGAAWCRYKRYGRSLPGPKGHWGCHGAENKGTLFETVSFQYPSYSNGETFSSWSYDAPQKVLPDGDPRTIYERPDLSTKPYKLGNAPIWHNSSSLYYDTADAALVIVDGTKINVSVPLNAYQPMGTTHGEVCVHVDLHVPVIPRTQKFQLGSSCYSANTMGSKLRLAANFSEFFESRAKKEGGTASSAFNRFLDPTMLRVFGVRLIHNSGSHTCDVNTVPRDHFGCRSRNPINALLEWIDVKHPGPAKPLNMAPSRDPRRTTHPTYPRGPLYALGGVSPATNASSMFFLTEGATIVHNSVIEVFLMDNYYGDNQGRVCQAVELEVYDVAETAPAAENTSESSDAHATSGSGSKKKNGDSGKSSVQAGPTTQRVRLTAKHGPQCYDAMMDQTSSNLRVNFVLGDFPNAVKTLQEQLQQRSASDASLSNAALFPLRVVGIELVHVNGTYTVQRDTVPDAAFGIGGSDIFVERILFNYTKARTMTDEDVGTSTSQQHEQQLADEVLQGFDTIGDLTAIVSPLLDPAWHPSKLASSEYTLGTVRPSVEETPHRGIESYLGFYVSPGSGAPLLDGTEVVLRLMDEGPQDNYGSVCVHLDLLVTADDQLATIVPTQVPPQKQPAASVSPSGSLSLTQPPPTTRSQSRATESKSDSLSAALVDAAATVSTSPTVSLAHNENTTIAYKKAERRRTITALVEVMSAEDAVAVEVSSSATLGASAAVATPTVATQVSRIASATRAVHCAWAVDDYDVDAQPTASGQNSGAASKEKEKENRDAAAENERPGFVEHPIQFPLGAGVLRWQAGCVFATSSLLIFAMIVHVAMFQLHRRHWDRQQQTQAAKRTSRFDNGFGDGSDVDEEHHDDGDDDHDGDTTPDDKDDAATAVKADDQNILKKVLVCAAGGDAVLMAYFLPNLAAPAVTLLTRGANSTEHGAGVLALFVMLSGLFALWYATRVRLPSSTSSSSSSKSHLPLSSGGRDSIDNDTLMPKPNSSASRSYELSVTIFHEAAREHQRREEDSVGCSLSKVVAVSVRSYFLEDVGSACVISAVSGIRPNTSSSCVGIASTIAFLGLCHLMYLLSIRPYASRMEQAFAVAFATAQACLGGVTIAWTFRPDDSANAQKAAGFLALILSATFFAQAVAEVAWLVYRRQKEHIQTNQKKFHNTQTQHKQQLKSSTAVDRGHHQDLESQGDVAGDATGEEEPSHHPSPRRDKPKRQRREENPGGGGGRHSTTAANSKSNPLDRPLLLKVPNLEHEEQH